MPARRSSGSRDIAMIGGGDHARVVLDILAAARLRCAGWVRASAASDDDRHGLPSILCLGDLTSATWVDPRLDFVAAIGNNSVRADAYARCRELGIQPASAIHPSALLLGGARVAPGTQVCAGAVVGVEADVRENVIINTAASIDHHCVLEAHCFVGPGARLAGRVSVGTGAHIGIGAIVKEGITIGPWALVAAGAVVVKDVLPGERVAGVPARPMKVPESER